MPRVPLSTSEISLVAAADDPVADRHDHRAVDAVLAERASVAALLAGAAVQGAAGVVVARDQDALLEPVLLHAGGPLGDRLVEGFRAVGEHIDAAGRDRPVEPALRRAVVESGECEPLRRVALTHHLRQPDGTQTVADRA